MHELMQLLASFFQPRALFFPDRRGAVFRINPVGGGGPAFGDAYSSSRATSTVRLRNLATVYIPGMVFLCHFGPFFMPISCQFGPVRRQGFPAEPFPPRISSPIQPVTRGRASREGEVETCIGLGLS